MTFPKAILFDLDDTLFDHQRASTIALRAMHAAHAPHLPFDAFAQCHRDVLEKFHRHYLDGQFTLDEARTARMKFLFASFGIDIDDATINAAAALYRQQHQANRALLPGALELLTALQPQARLGIVTNNSTVEQHEKLRALGIAHFFDTVVISEDAGFAKPDPRIFAIALERIGARAEESVFLGDSWQNDVQGALSAGIGAIWLNRIADKETPALERTASHFVPETLTSAGVSFSSPVEINSLTPLSTVLAAIKKAFTKRTPGVTENEQLETLAS